MAEHNELGKKGEDEAEQYLRNKGYKILERNWICEKYEIDIIAEGEGFIIFVEVKTRSSRQWGNPEEAISNSKMKRMVTAADYYIINNDIDFPARFDVIAVVWNGSAFEIEHFDDAFLPPVN
mgnify:CR=1 FL=1